MARISEGHNCEGGLDMAGVGIVSAAAPIRLPATRRVKAVPLFIDIIGATSRLPRGLSRARARPDVAFYEFKSWNGTTTSFSTRRSTRKASCS
jgi:hypothetical protein